MAKHNVGDRVKVVGPVHGEGKTGRISQVAPSGHFYGVEIGGQHAGYYHESDIARQPAGKTRWTKAGQAAGEAEGRRHMAAAKAAMATSSDRAQAAHDIVKSQGGAHSGSPWDESKHPRHAAGSEQGGEFVPKDMLVGDVQPGDTIHGITGKPFMHVERVHNAREPGYKVFEGTFPNGRPDAGIRPEGSGMYPAGHKSRTLPVSSLGRGRK